jgi:hypothetical protein
MAQIPRPPKQGNVTTYVAKVAAGYTKILAGEMDADLDTIYGAWNGGADTVNLRDGAVTGPKLAPDAVGPRELADSGVQTAALADGAVTTPKIADGAVTDPKIISVSWTKLIGTAPPPPAGSVTTAQLVDGAVTSAKIADGSVGTVDLATAAVTRPILAPGAIIGSVVSAVAPPGFLLSTANVWTPVVTLPVLATRGTTAVLLLANHNLSASGPAASGVCNQRWLRNGAPLTTWPVVTASAAYVPIPGIVWIDLVPGAGNYTYEYDVQVSANCFIIGSGVAGGAFVAVELG